MKNDKTAILVVDDEAAVRNSLSSWFQKDGFTTGAAADAVEALKKLAERSWDIILLDIKMPNIDGMELLQRIRRINPDIVVIMITAYATVDTAVEALKGGAFDYVMKPIDPDDLSRIVRKAVEQRKLVRENLRLRTRVQEFAPEEDLLGKSAKIQKVRDTVESLAESDVSVLIRGDSGTGKELIARLIHAKSPRRHCPIVPVNCGAFTETLLESELFGHEKGSFTGAQYKHRGKLEIAAGGTLFLDEIGTISMKTQVDLLRVLDTKQFTRVGGNQVISTDFRVISATNQDLEQLVKDGQFREDFYYRINVFPLIAPSLAERREDISILAKHFLKLYARQIKKKIDRFTPEALKSLEEHNWPGNVRELKNAIERACVVSSGPEITAEDLPIHVRDNSEKPVASTLEAVEKAHIVEMLERSGWNITQTAQALGIDRVTLYNKIKKYSLRD
jgi:DNA-binding NtrC family response regulator